MPVVDTTSGGVEYDDTGGAGPVLVLLHGVLMSGTVWRDVIPQLAPRYRCVVPTLPLGAHRRAMRPDADLSLAGMGRLVDELLERLDLEEVTLVQNDWGAAQPLFGQNLGARVSRLVITSSEAFDNYPPPPARPLVWASYVPGGLVPIMWALQHRVVQRAPRSWGWMSIKPVPADVIGDWMRPAHRDRLVRRDLVRYCRARPSTETLLRWAERTTCFTGPVLVVWATRDRMMPLEHAHRLVDQFPDSRLVTIDDSYTLIPEDQPERLSQTLLDFLLATDTDLPGPDAATQPERPR